MEVNGKTQIKFLENLIKYCRENNSKALLKALNNSVNNLEKGNKFRIFSKEISETISKIRNLINLILAVDDISIFTNYFTEQYNELCQKQNTGQLELQFDFEETAQTITKKGIIKQNDKLMDFTEIPIDDKLKYIKNLKDSCVTIIEKATYNKFNGTKIVIELPLGKTFAFLLTSLELTPKEFGCKEEREEEWLRSNAETPYGISELSNALRDYMKDKQINIDNEIDNYEDFYRNAYNNCEIGKIIQKITELNCAFLINDEKKRKEEGKETGITAFKDHFQLRTFSPNDQNSGVRRRILLRIKD